MRQKFEDYLKLRESDESKSSGEKKTAHVGTSFSLGKDNDFKPFFITDDPRNQSYPANKNLAPIVRAFKDSNKVRVYDSADKDGNPKPHTLGSKRLFMVGGPVRDHILGKTPKDVDLATDATPDEIRMILRDADFEERGSDDRSSKSKSSSSKSSKFFYPKGSDGSGKGGKDFVFGIRVGGQEFELATFRKDGKYSDGRRPDEVLPGNHKDDANRRDLTMNSLYLLLNNPDGPNTQVTDFHGGIHDITNGKVRFVGNANDRLAEDPLRAPRYARFAARFGKGEVDPDYADAVMRIIPKLKDSVSPDRIQDEFLKGLSYDDVEPSSLVNIYKKLGLLDVVLPGMVKMSGDAPLKMPESRDPSLTLAALTLGNRPEVVRECLRNMRFKGQYGNRVAFLHKVAKLNSAVDPVTLEQLRAAYDQTGILDSTILEWMKYTGKGESPAVKAFLEMTKQPRVSPFVETDSLEETVNSSFRDLINPATMQPYEGKGPSIGERKRRLEWENFQELCRKNS